MGAYEGIAFAMEPVTINAGVRKILYLHKDSKLRSLTSLISSTQQALIKTA